MCFIQAPHLTTIKTPFLFTCSAPSFLQALFYNMNESMERVLDLLQFAEDVSKNVESSASLTEQDTQRFSMFDLEPIPIGPNGIQKVVAKIPPLSWNCSSSAQELASAFRGAAFPVSGIALPSTAVEIPSHYQKDQPYTNVAVTTMDMPKRVLLPESPVAATALLQKPRVLSPMTEAASVVSMSSISTSAHTDPDKDRYRTYQKGQWNERFAELLEFRAAHGHLFVPHTYPPNQKLAQWVKRYV
jgi:Helicase associated domain